MTSSELLCLAVVDLTFGLRLPSASWRAALAERYAPFLVSLDAPA